MSSIKRYIEETEGHQSLKECLEALIETDEIRDAALGVARLLIADPSAQLSIKQQDVFDRHIEPHLSVECSAPDCSSPIPADLVPGVILSGDGEYCHECAYTYRDRRDD